MKTYNLCRLNYLNLFLCLFMALQASFATKIYVDKDNKFGNGANNNWPGTIDQPKLNFQHDWFQRNLKPGDTVVVRQAQSYGEIRFYGNIKGTKDQPIVVMAYPGESIVLDSNVLPSQFGIRLLPDASDISLLGPFVIKGKEYCFSAFKNNDGVVFENAEISNGKHGPRLNGTTNSTFRNLLISDLSINGVQLRGSESAATGDPCVNILFENVTVYNIDDNREPQNSDADGFHSYGGEDIVFKNCRTWDNAEDGFDLNSNATLINCWSYNNKAAGLKAWRRSGDGYAEKTITAINSIFHNNGYHPADTNPGVKVSLGAGLNLYNCIVSNNYDQGVHVRVKLKGHGYDPLLEMGLEYLPVKIYNTIITDTQNGAGIRDSGALLDIPLLESDHNLYFNNKVTAEGFAPRENSITNENPNFTDIENLDFTLSPSSPAIDSGQDLSNLDATFQMYGLTDLNDMIRPFGVSIDIGPYEFGSTEEGGDGEDNVDDEGGEDSSIGEEDGTAVDNEDQPDIETIKIYPNPTADKIHIHDPKKDYMFYQLFDMGGGIILNGKIEGNNDIDISNCSSGTYVLVLQNLKDTKSYRVIKKN